MKCNRTHKAKGEDSSFKLVTLLTRNTLWYPGNNVASIGLAMSWRKTAIEGTITTAVNNIGYESFHVRVQEGCL